MKSTADAARYSLERCRDEVQLAVQRFLTFDWSRMNLWDVAMVSCTAVHAPIAPTAQGPCPG